MAEERDQSERTEEPTPRRLQKAREEGQVASSREVHTLFVLATATLLLAAGGGPAAGLVARLFEASFTRIAGVGAGGGAAAAVRAPELALAALLVLLPLVALALAAVLASAVQNAIVWTGKAIAPQLSRISPLAGAKRLFSRRTLVELAKNLAKLAIAALAATVAIWPELGVLGASPALEPAAFALRLSGLVLRLFLAVCVAVALVAILDYAFQRAEHLKQLRMSRRDIREEHRETEGDPLVRQRLRQIRMERARRRMMAEVPKSTVVVTNPVHFAVALRYRQGKDAVPEVVAKGADLLARRIRELARAHGVPIVEDPPLARLLYATTEPGRPIPPAHYEAVARVIAFVLRMGQGGAGADPTS